MGARKYAGDYRLENVPGRKGKLRTVPVYRGARFRFSSPPERLRSAKRRCLLCHSAASVGLLIPMLLTVEMLRRWYVLLPLVLCLLPAAGLWRSVYRLFTARETVIREHKEQMQEQLAGAGVALMILAGLSLLGQIAAYFRGCGAENWSLHLCTVLVIAASAALFAGRNALRLEEVPKEE